LLTKKLGCPSVDETQNRFNLYEWFTNIGELKSNYNYVAKLGFAFIYA
jgi:transcriptional regulator with AAA-type ATPase domain